MGYIVHEGVLYCLQLKQVAEVDEVELVLFVELDFVPRALDQFKDLLDVVFVLGVF